MAEDSKVVPMRPLRDVLREFEALIESEEAGAANNGPCEHCNGTGTETIRNEQGIIVSARPCSH